MAADNAAKMRHVSARRYETFYISFYFSFLGVRARRDASRRDATRASRIRDLSRPSPREQSLPLFLVESRRFFSIRKGKIRASRRAIDAASRHPNKKFLSFVV